MRNKNTIGELIRRHNCISWRFVCHDPLLVTWVVLHEKRLMEKPEGLYWQSNEGLWSFLTHSFIYFKIRTSGWTDVKRSYWRIWRTNPSSRSTDIPSHNGQIHANMQWHRSSDQIVLWMAHTWNASALTSFTARAQVPDTTRPAVHCRPTSAIHN